MTDKTLKNTLVAAIVFCLLLAAGLAYEIMQRRSAVPPQKDAELVVASGPVTDSAPTGKTPVAATTDPVLAPVQLTPQRMQEIGVTTAPVEMKEASSSLDVPGNVAMNEQGLSYVQTRFPGWVRTVFANATYQSVKKGQRLFTIYSPDLVSSEQEYLLAKKNQVDTSDHMHGMAASEGNWLLQAATERLQRLDIPDSALADLDRTGKVSQEIAIESPVSGFIIERNALPNAYIQPDTKLYTIADLSSVWVYANVFQNDVGRLKPGNLSQVSVDAYPGRKFKGRVDQILPDVDPTTRTVRVRLVLGNPGLALKPGMYVNVHIAAPMGRQLMIPASGVLQSGNREIAFIDRGQGNLEPREIETGPRLDDSVVVLKGLKQGDRIVTSANFLVDSEAQLQGAANGFAPMPKSADDGQKPAEDVHVDFATHPSPPQKGANTVRVKLTGADGKPLTGVQVNIVFFMPAMPAMGMAASHAEANLADRGNGAFEGSLQLSSGGTWSATITVSRNGQTLATKKLSVSAAGGMA
ncbi:MAG TPA: efflux RND transporter periplasmic adaptor subunit [Terracidiphilus sp.]|jgi:RND family efflux transporter MFP subunit|nr:efflux RND transporter periplasmic adaptor subunit [Terracidiphilus sp.]